MKENSKVGFIGYGSMGRMLVEGFLRNCSLQPESIMVATRTQSKLHDVTRQIPGIHIGTNVEVASHSELLFLCVKPTEARSVLGEIAVALPSDCHVVSIAACVELANLGRLFHGSISRVIPSLTSETDTGVSLVCHNPRVSNMQKRRLEGLLGSIGIPKEIPETDLEVGSDLTSCAPGLIAAIFEQFALAGVRAGKISPADATEMIVETLYGTAKLFKEKGLGFRQTIERVATKGGITELGTQVLAQGLPAVFDDLFVKTLERHGQRRAAIQDQFDA